MKTSAIKLTAGFFLLALFCSLRTPVFSQTIMNVPPRQLAKVVSQQLFVNDEKQPGDSNVAIHKIDSVLCDGVTIIKPMANNLDMKNTFSLMKCFSTPFLIAKTVLFYLHAWLNILPITAVQASISPDM